MGEGSGSYGTGAELIAAERQRQIEAEGWTPEHDDESLVKAAVCYAHRYRSHPTSIAGGPPRWWPWDDDDWKLTDDPIRNLVKAGALIAAEIDRIQRADALEGDSHG